MSHPPGTMIRESKKLLSLSFIRGCAFSSMLLLTLHSCQGQETMMPNDKVFAYYPLAKGNLWNYAVSRRRGGKNDTVSWQVTQDTKQADGRFFALWPKPPQEDDSQQLLVTEQGLKDVPTGYYLIPWPVKIGSEWHYEIEKGDPSKKFSVSFKVASAGTPCDVQEHHFSDCLIVEQRNEETDLRVVTTYARDVGPAKYVYYRLRGGRDGELLQSVELVSFTLQRAGERRRAHPK